MYITLPIWTRIPMNSFTRILSDGSTIGLSDVSDDFVVEFLFDYWRTHMLSMGVLSHVVRVYDFSL